MLPAYTGPNFGMIEVDWKLRTAKLQVRLGYKVRLVFHAWKALPGV